MKGRAIMLFCALMLTGCTYAKISGRGPVPLMLNNPTQRVEVIKHFDVTKHSFFDWTGAFDVSSVTARILQENPTANGIANLTISAGEDGATFFANLFTLGLANAKFFRAEGDLIRFTTAGAGDAESAQADEMITVWTSSGQVIARKP